MTKRTRYLSYLLRMWQTSDGRVQVWRASLETPGSGERRGFASLDDLVRFLRNQASAHSQGLDAPDEKKGR